MNWISWKNMFAKKKSVKKNRRRAKLYIKEMVIALSPLCINGEIFKENDVNPLLKA